MLNFLSHANKYILGINPEDLDSKNLLFWWQGKSKMQCIYHSLFLKFNDDHKHRTCPDLCDRNFEVLCMTVLLDSYELEFTNIFKVNTTGISSCYSTYSNMLYFLGCC